MDAGLEEKLTDSGLGVLASAGCGPQLTSLTLSSELYVWRVTLRVAMMVMVLIASEFSLIRCCGCRVGGRSDGHWTESPGVSGMWCTADLAHS